MRAVPSLSPTPFKKSSGLGLSGLCSAGACWDRAPESDACSSQRLRASGHQDTVLRAERCEGAENGGALLKSKGRVETAGEKRFLPGFSAVAIGTCLDLTPISTQALHTGTVMPHSETPEWFGYCSGTKRCDIRELGLVSMTLHPTPL